MRSILSLLLLAGIRLVAAQHDHGSGDGDHDHGMPSSPTAVASVSLPPPVLSSVPAITSSIAPPVSSAKPQASTTPIEGGHDHGSGDGDHDHGTPIVSVPVPTGPGKPAPSGCKLIPGDSGFPTLSEVTAALPGAMSVDAGSAPAGHKRPQYMFQATTVAQVQAAVKFASEKNIRLSILNSGHDFLGRNDAPSGLSLDVSKLKGIRVAKSYIPSIRGVKSVNSTELGNVIDTAGGGAVVTFGAGVSTQELNNHLDKSKLTTVGAAHGSVKTAGGWGQTAGHAPLSAYFGLGVDQVLEYKIVTPDGKLRVANRIINSDLFWALRGGGGGTFGVVVEATVRAYPTPKITVTNWWINSTDTGIIAGDGFWNAMQYLHQQFPQLSAKGAQGYYYTFPKAALGLMLTPGEHSGIDKAKALWEPVLQKMSTFPNMTNFTVKYYDYTSYKHYFDVRLGPLCEETEMPGHSHEEEEPGHTHEAEGPNPIPLPTGSAAPTGPAGDGHDHEHRSIDSFEKIERSLWKRHEGMDAPMGIMPMDSRLLGKKHFDHPEFARALKAAYPLVPGGLLRGHLIGGGKVLRPTEPTSVLPAWRRAYSHLIATYTKPGEANIDSLRAISPDSGAYVNEATNLQPNWKKDFWGINYPRLSALKSKYDPKGLLWVTPGINADHFKVVDGRVCATPKYETSVSPLSDNFNLGTRSTEGTDTYSAFPETGIQPNPLQGTCQAGGHGH